MQTAQQLGETTPGIPAQRNGLTSNERCGLSLRQAGAGRGISIEVAGIRRASLSDTPRVLDGAGHSPPEDRGGIGGFKKAINAYGLLSGSPSERVRTAAGIGTDYEPDDEARAEAEDLLDWAQNMVGWQRFESASDLANAFNMPGRT